MPYIRHSELDEIDARLLRLFSKARGRAATIRRLDAEVMRLREQIKQLGIWQVDYELGVRCGICGQEGLIPATIVHHPDCEAR